MLIMQTPKLPDILGVSTYRAEYMAASAAVYETIRLSEALWEDGHPKRSTPTTL